VILSSGFLAFASHVGFLRGLERCNIAPGALMGTSSGALVGALYSAGHGVGEIAKMLTSEPPLRFLTPHWQPWKGVFDSEPLLRFLEARLPTSFDELRWPFAVGVTALDTNRHQLLTRGSPARAVLASCAVPRLILPVRISGVDYADGGTLDRLGLVAWREWRPARPGILHRIERSMGSERPNDLAGVSVVNSPRSGNTLFRLRDFHEQMASACDVTETTLRVSA
jgi:predicted acylesterase/phospholipase RssA